MVEVWIGLVEVVSMNADGDSLLDGSPGAYVQALTPASDAEDYHRRVQAASASLGLTIVSVEDFEPFASRIAREKSSGLSSLADDAAQSGTVWATFHLYPQVDQPLE
jgi:hypothetical protein